MKHFKIRTIIITTMSVTAAVGILLLCVLATVNSNKILEEKINENMSTYLDAQANSVTEFVKEAENKLTLYSKSGEVAALILDDAKDAAANPSRVLPEFNDPDYNTTAYYIENYPNYSTTQAYTLDFYGSLDNWEGLYVGNLDTRILSYSVPPVVGKVLRADPDKKQQLLDAMNADLNGVYNAGIIVSPGTGKLCLSMYCPVLQDGKMIGYVGGGVFHTELEEILTGFKLKGVENSNFYMLNYETAVTFTDTQASPEEQEAIIAQETTRPVLLAVVEKAKAGSDKGEFDFKDSETGKTLVVTYEKIPGYDWAIVITADKNELYAASKSTLSTMLILGIIALAIIIVFATVLAVALSNSLGKTVEELNKTAAGDITSEVDIKSSVLEINQIRDSFTDLKAKFSEVIDKTTNVSKELNFAGTELNSSAGHASEASGHVTQSVSEVSKGAQSQAESVQTAAVRMDSMGQDIDNISGNIRTLDEASKKMKNSCDQAALALNEIVTQNKNVSNAINEIEETIHATNESANEIAKFSDAINNIASQTNLLSLNASIEAARAGEAGRGFAVVADEIRQLADQSKTSADEIRTIVDNLLGDAQASVKTMDALNESFRLQGEQIVSTQQDMDEMAENVTVVSENSKAISDMVKNLEKAKDSLVEIVENLSAISEENAASTQETNASMAELGETFSVISESATQLQSLANDITETIGYFK